MVWFREDTFLSMLKDRWIIDARVGGLVIGRSHENGEVCMIQEVQEEIYAAAWFMEGWEYIINHGSWLANKERLNEINAETVGDHAYNVTITVSEKTRILNTSSTPTDKIFLIDARGQFIVNKFATAKYFAELEAINSVNNDYLTCDIDSLQSVNQAETDPT